MPAHPVLQQVRFTLADGTNVILIFDHLGNRRPTVHRARVIEAVELVACHVFNLAEQTRQRITFGDVERYLAQGGRSSRRLWLWPLWVGAQGAPSGENNEVPNRPSHRARIRFLAKSSVLDVSDHCTPTPSLSASSATASRTSTWPTPAAWLTVATIGTPNSRRLAGS